ncbi:PREDICTED: WAS/WASL-interacting protein family member 3-like [Papilio polytes]|uniref:WAS/WASL-interacting protein family member 3-like n=1 Tax=Papilio polytes TaxID=76194 RepID=UPI000675DA36|nr:PREDICTED: WAS/WASL-interacting protein family member 3-like [Papilio polytes]
MAKRDTADDKGSSECMSRGSGEASPMSGAASPRASPPVTPGSPRRSPLRSPRSPRHSPSRSPRLDRSEAGCSPAPSVGSAGSRDAAPDPRPQHHIFSPFEHSGAFRSSGGEQAPAPPAPPLFLPPHLSHLSHHLNQLSQPFFPLKGWGAPCPCCPKEEARSSSVAELRRKAHEHSAALLHSLASFQSRALLPLPLPPLPLPLPLLPHDSNPPTNNEHKIME